MFAGALASAYEMLVEALTTYPGGSALLDGLNHFPTMFVYAAMINSTVARPIAYQILAFCMAIELVQVVLRAAESSGNGMVVFDGIFKMIFKYMICKAVVDRAGMILQELFNLSATATTSMNSLSSTITFNWPTGVIDALIDQMTGGMESISVLVLLILSFLVVWIAKMLITVIITVRFVHVYVLYAFAPIPLATFMADGHWNMGIGFAKHWLAACFHGCVLYFIIGSFQALAADMAAASTTIIGACTTIVGCNIVLCVCLFSAEALASKIFS